MLRFQGCCWKTPTLTSYLCVVSHRKRAL
jgi:hypothetical protein